MKGYFITNEKAIELGLLENPNVASQLQKTVIVITQNEIIDKQKNIQQNENQFEEMANWFYRNYFDDLVDTLSSFN